MAKQILLLVRKGFKVIFVGLNIPTSEENYERLNELKREAENGFSIDSDKIFSDFSSVLSDLNISLEKNRPQPQIS